MWSAVHITKGEMRAALRVDTSISCPANLPTLIHRLFDLAPGTWTVDKEQYSPLIDWKLEAQSTHKTGEKRAAMCFVGSTKVLAALTSKLCTLTSPISPGLPGSQGCREIKHFPDNYEI